MYFPIFQYKSFVRDVFHLILQDVISGDLIIQGTEIHEGRKGKL